jgi:hypothetical protein
MCRASYPHPAFALILSTIPHPSDVPVRIVDVVQPCEHRGWPQKERRAIAVGSPLRLVGRYRRLRVRRARENLYLGKLQRRTRVWRPPR